MNVHDEVWDLSNKSHILKSINLIDGLGGSDVRRVDIEGHSGGNTGGCTIEALGGLSPLIGMYRQNLLPKALVVNCY